MDRFLCLQKIHEGFENRCSFFARTAYPLASTYGTVTPFLAAATTLSPLSSPRKKAAKLESLDPQISASTLRVACSCGSSTGWGVFLCFFGDTVFKSGWRSLVYGSMVTFAACFGGFVVGLNGNRHPLLLSRLFFDVALFFNEAKR